MPEGHEASPDADPGIVGEGQDGDAGRATVAAYDADAQRYAAASAQMPDSVLRDLTEYAAALGPGARILEIGSGGGRDALALEDLGMRVRRTDISAGFVAVLRGQGHRADHLDPLHDDLTDPEGLWDGVWANASLLHVARVDLPEVLTRLAAVTTPGGMLRISLKQGDGDGWSTHGSVSAPRHFTYWQPDPLLAAVEAAGWQDVHWFSEVAGPRDERWIELSARRGGA